MTDNTRIGPGHPGGAIDLIKQNLGLGVPASGRGAGSPSSSAPPGPRGQRMLSPDTPVDSLDRNAQRGTYLDILV